MSRNERLFLIVSCVIIGLFVPPAVIVIGPRKFMVFLVITFLVVLAIQAHNNRKERLERHPK